MSHQPYTFSLISSIKLAPAELELPFSLLTITTAKVMPFPYDPSQMPAGKKGLLIYKYLMTTPVLFSYVTYMKTTTFQRY